MKKLIVLSCLMAITGCQNTQNLLGNYRDGSLDYVSAQKLPPLQLPAHQANIEFVPLYPTPAVGQNTLDLTNQSGKQYRLPKPPQISQ